MSTISKKLCSVITLTIILFVFSESVFAEGEVFRVYGDPGANCDWGFNHAGYSDNFNWGYEPNRHPYSYHEMLSGEFGAALAWSQSGSNQAYWLTDSFHFPDFGTGSIFQSYSPYYNSWDDSNNPIDNIDTAYAVIRDNQNRIQVRMDYEVVDLGQQDANGIGGSPITFRDANGTVAYVNSEQYILLCTYSIKNVSDSNITGLEFYQMLCGYPSGYDGYYSSYASENYSDPLASYIPYNPVHKEQGSNYAGKFRYDISQWGAGNPNTEHVDWISFSSTVPPDVVENGIFCSNGGEPTTGTYTNIKNRSLNGNLYSVYSGYYSSERVAGAMKWNLGNLEPNQTVKHTIAVMFGCRPVNHTPPTPVSLTKTDDIGGCVSPDSLINYEICFDANGHSDTNVVLTDHLPDEVDFNSYSYGGTWDSNTRTVTWNIGTMAADDNDCFHLQVKVNSNAIQGQTITNTCELTGDNFSKQATEDTNVCCYAPIVYVDINIPASGNGRSWQTAYKELRNALINVRDGNCGCADQIWVAKGTYKPTNDTNKTDANFAMLDGINLYGHFDGNETSISQRNLADSNNETILSGDVDDDNDNGDVYYVVTAADANFDGFTIKKSTRRGISCSTCSPTIENCVFKNNNLYGIYCESGAQAIITNTFVNNNGNCGIYCVTSGTQVDIDRCTVVSNSAFGLWLAGGAAVNAVDSVFSQTISGIGIYADCSSVLFVDRCDISDNGSIGIKCSDHARAVIKRCYIQRNTGYGLCMNDSNEVESTLNIISDNYNYSAMGVFIDGASDKCSLRNNLIYSNASSGIYVCNSSEIRNNTIVNNEYGISGYGDPNINSNIIWDNDVNSLSGTFNNVNYNCIQGGHTGTGNIDVDPCFVNKDANDYHLKNISPCIDKGDPNFIDANEVDIDGEDRIMDGDSNGTARVDIGADEFCPYDLSQDGFVNFLDFSVIAATWKKSLGQADYNDYCDFYNDNVIDYKDLDIFCQYWLTPAGWAGIGGQGAYFAENSSSGEGGEMMAMQQPEQEADEMMMELPEDEQQSMMAGEGETAAVYLISDVNEPNSGDEVTVQIYTDTPLFCMGLIITVTGDANITGAVSTADCNEYGWDPDWPTDPYIDPEGWVYVSGVSWLGEANGIVGYIRFHYNSGQVTVSIDEDSDAFDAYCEPALISGESLTFGTDPNES
jgi:parallel beta-helix repeat protein